MVNSNSSCSHNSLKDMGFFFSQISIFSSAFSQYSLETKGCDQLTWFLCLPTTPARWEISCVHLALRESLAGDQSSAPWRMVTPIQHAFEQGVQNRGYPQRQRMGWCLGDRVLQPHPKLSWCPEAVQNGIEPFCLPYNFSSVTKLGEAVGGLLGPPAVENHIFHCAQPSSGGFPSRKATWSWSWAARTMAFAVLSRQTPWPSLHHFQDFVYLASWRPQPGRHSAHLVHRPTMLGF